jgi:hypothetical protein
MWARPGVARRGCVSRRRGRWMASGAEKHPERRARLMFLLVAPSWSTASSATRRVVDHDVEVHLLRGTWLGGCGDAKPPTSRKSSESP